MNIIQKIQNKPQAVKLKIIWTVVIIFGILLIGVWIISSRYYKRTNKDATLFQTIEQGVKDVRNNFHK